MSRIGAVCEKPSVAKVVRSLRPQWTVVALQGHVLETVVADRIDPGLRFNPARLPFFFDKIHREPNPKLATRVAEFGRMLSDTDVLVIATDQDREGALIGYELLEHFGQVGRDLVYLNTLDPEPDALRKQIEIAERDIGKWVSKTQFYCWAYAGLGRQSADWHVGMNATQYGSTLVRPRGWKGANNAGNVLDPLLGLIVQNHLAIENFKPTAFYLIHAEVETSTGDNVTLTHSPDPRLTDKAVADAIAAAAIRQTGPLSVEQTDITRAPPPLYNLPRLERDAARAFGWKPNRTLEVAQALYDDALLLTYPRGQSQVLPESQAPMAAQRLGYLSTLPELTALQAYLAGNPPVIRSDRYNDAKLTAGHHAIVPTGRTLDGLYDGKVAGGLDAVAPKDRDAALKLFNLVAWNFAANHLPDGVDLRHTVSMQVQHAGESLRFAASATRVSSPGWRSLGQPPAEDDDEPDADPAVATLPPIADGTPGTVTDTRLHAGKTKPPRRFREGDLSVRMSRLIDEITDPATRAKLLTDDPDQPKGLGTPATRGSHIRRIIDELGYVERIPGRTGKPAKNAQVRPSALGLEHYNTWAAIYPRLVDPVTRALTEALLTDIEKAAHIPTARRLLDEFLAGLKAELGDIDAAVRARPEAQERAQPRSSEPTPAMLQFAQSLAKQTGIDLPADVATDYKVCRTYIENAKATLAKVGRANGEITPPTAKQLNYCRQLAKEKNVKLPPAAEHDSREASRFISQMTGKK